MMPSDEAALLAYQAHRDTGREVMHHVIAEAMQSPEYTTTQAIVQFCMSEGVTPCVNMNSITGYRLESCWLEAF